MCAYTRACVCLVLDSSLARAEETSPNKVKKRLPPTQKCVCGRREDFPQQGKKMGLLLEVGGDNEQRYTSGEDNHLLTLGVKMSAVAGALLG